MVEISINILLFFIYCFGLGYTFTRSIKNISFETTVIRIGIGLGSIPVLGIILSLLHIPIDWRIILIISILLPLIDLIKGIKAPFKNTKFNYRFLSATTLLILLFLLNFFVYTYGAFRYPWLEDDDPWSHAASAKFVAVEKTLNVVSGQFEYLNPYPPGYALVMGIMHQTNTSMYFTLKFFNSIIVSFSIILFFYFAEEFLKDKTKAIFAAIFISLIPCYVSHFIWAHSMIICLLFPAFYCILKIRNDSRYFIPSIVVVSGIFLTQPTQSVKFIILILLLWLAYCLSYRKFWKTPLAILCIAGLLSMLWWGTVFINKSDLKLMRRTGVSDLDGVSQKVSFTKKLFSPGSGSATKAYTFKDFWLPPRDNYINNPIGVGGTLLIMSFLGLFLSLFSFKKSACHERFVKLTTLLWLAFTFLGLNSKTFNLPVGLFAFRFWMLFAVPVSFLAAELTATFYRLTQNRVIRTLILSLIILSVFQTSGMPKISLNTGIWLWGVGWGSPQELNAYVQLRKRFKPDTKVFTFTKNYFVLGNNMMSDYWSKKYKNSFSNAFGLNVNQLHDRLKYNHFKYIIIGQRDARQYGLVAVNNKLMEVNKSGMFKLDYYREEGAFVYKVL